MAAAVTLWFVTPAWRRYDLSAVCFDQRLDVIRTLAANGIEARCVVVADDENLDLARERGFDVVEQDNEWLGRKFNDGIEYACRNGASRVVPIGSDSWIDPAYFLPMIPRFHTLTSGLYAVVTADRMAEVNVTDVKGAGPYIFNRLALRNSGFRPARDDIKRGVDRSTIKGIRMQIRWKRRDLHPFQYIGFRGEPHLTPYETLRDVWGVREHLDPWTILAEHYPVNLVERALAVIAKQAEAVEA
jgi:hypothetical protein